MIERRPFPDFLTHLVLILGVVIVAFPVYVVFVASSLTAQDVLQAPMTLIPGPHLIENYRRADARHGQFGHAGRHHADEQPDHGAGDLARQDRHLHHLGFRHRLFPLPAAQDLFWLIFVTLMLPVEVRILPTYKVVSDPGMINSYFGLTIPIIASATATFLFRQFFLTIPDELAEAARIDGAGPLKFFWDVVLPLSRTSIAALFVIQFIYGWNQYLWPLLITTDKSLTPIVLGVTQMISRSGDSATDWNLLMATVMLAMVPPAPVVIFMQRWFVKGPVETEK